MNPKRFAMWRTSLLLCCVCIAFIHPGAAAERANILIVIADDATFRELPPYGGKNVATPELERLAEQGMLFRRAYVGMAMCTPCRTELYTGLYPMRSGVCWNHALARPGTRSLPQIFGELGYRVGLAGKIHVQPRSVFSFEMVEGFERNCVARTADHDCAGIREFMSRPGAQPFCLVVALVVPHAPWTVGDPSHFDRAKLVLAPYYVDTPETRDSLARYLGEMEVMDKQLGDILSTLQGTGKAEQTLVVFTSEQGGQWPGCKWTNWEEGLHTGLVVRWPGHVKAGSQTDALVQYADFVPTLLEAAGTKPPKDAYDGSSFLGVLEGRTRQHRQLVYGMHNNLPEGPPYPIRSVSDGKFRFIRNLTPEALYVEKHVMGKTDDNPYWLSWVWAMESDPRALAMVSRYMRRPAEELYDLGSDPYETNNLAADIRFAGARQRLAAALGKWMRDQGDPGAQLDTREMQTANKERVEGPGAKKRQK